MRIFKSTIFLGALIYLAGCSQSAVYSPSYNLSTESLKKDQIDFQGGMELMPEARAETLGGRPTTLGLNTQISYGISDEFNLSVKAWGDIEGRESVNRGGFALSAQFIRTLSESEKLIILPRAGMALSDGIESVLGYGFSSTILYQKTIHSNVSLYTGLGLIYGIHDLGESINTAGIRRLQSGFGLTANAGFAWQFHSNFRFNFELNPVYQINNFDENAQLLLSPSVGIAYLLKR